MCRPPGVLKHRVQENSHTRAFTAELFSWHAHTGSSPSRQRGPDARGDVDGSRRRDAKPDTRGHGSRDVSHETFTQANAGAERGPALPAAGVAGSGHAVS